MNRFALLVAAILFVVAGLVTDVRATEESGRPNVVLIMTDDQGYGDLACHGNSEISTPALDRLHAESVRLTNYHVDPTCSPTRAALMTGRYSSRTGVWHTIMGRSMMHKDEVTMADLFAASGYRTGAFGKWHLGDNYPLRAQDRGFHEVLMHGGGGVGQTPDFWGNDYFDDTYWHNGVAEKQKGYCTDVFFDAALSFIEANKEQPFFVYLPTNAAHGPFNVAKNYSEPYKRAGIKSPRAEFYGMITNIDENVGRMRKKLAEWGLAENTIFIFTTDNGTAAGTRGGGYGAGMRGAKGSEYEGGHRVPFFVHWPTGKLTGGRDVDVLSAHIDVLPTLLELCGLKPHRRVDIDGVSLVQELKDEIRDPKSEIRNRTLFVHSQRVEKPQKWRKSAVMTSRWRLVNGKELYDLKVDPGQKRNVAADNSAVVEKLRGAYDGWWKHISDRFDDYVRIELGSPHVKSSRLTCHDWHTGDGPVPWHQAHVQKDLNANGYWAVDVLRDGTYEITLRTRPEQVKHLLKAAAARVKIGDAESWKKIDEDAKSVSFRVGLTKGPAKLQTWLEKSDGTSHGAYFVDVRFVK